MYLCDGIVATCIHRVYVASQEPLQAPLMQMECLNNTARGVKQQRRIAAHCNLPPLKARIEIVLLRMSA